MAKRRTEQAIPEEVHNFLSAQGKKGGKKGGAITSRLVALGKKALGWDKDDEEFEQQPRRKVA